MAYSLLPTGTLFLDEVANFRLTLQADYYARFKKAINGLAAHLASGRISAHLRHEPRPESRRGKGEFRLDFYHRMCARAATCHRCATAAGHSGLGAALLKANGQESENIEFRSCGPDFLKTRDYPGNIVNCVILVLRIAQRHVDRTITAGAIPEEDRSEHRCSTSRLA